VIAAADEVTTDGHVDAAIGAQQLLVRRPVEADVELLRQHRRAVGERHELEVTDAHGCRRYVVSMAEADGLPFHLKDKVEAAADLPGVPVGTPGVVAAVAGLSWIRYRVRFENGVELGTLDAKYLVLRKP
jgi:hypothetical protein